MTNSPKVVFNYKFELAINNPDRHRRSENKIIKRTVGMFDYYSNVKKQAMNIFDYYTGDINKNEKRIINCNISSTIANVLLFAVMSSTRTICKNRFGDCELGRCL